MRFVLFDHVRLVLVAGYINMLLELVEAHGYIGPHKAALVKNGLDVAQLMYLEAELQFVVIFIYDLIYFVFFFFF